LVRATDELSLCVPQLFDALTGYPPSAVTTVQTGTDCTQYGDPPATVVNDILSPDGLQSLIDICSGTIVTLTDNLGETRQACLYENPNSSEENPLPLVVWLHPSLVAPWIAWPLTGWDAYKTTEPLNNEDPSLVGFSYLLPVGRNTDHYYPITIADNEGLGWDNWYRNLDRSSPGLNADVDFIDKAIALAKSRVPVDERRVFLSGWSNGAAMALEYGLNTDGIAAVSVYSAPDPYRDSQDPCTQVPYPLFATPTQDVHNYCDIIGICTTGLYFYQDLRNRYPTLQQSFVVIDDLTTDVVSTDDDASCDPNCQGTCAVTTGTLAHLRFPVTRNSDTFFAFLRNNPLPESGTWGAPS
jgi:hypothetical protein